MFGFWLFRLETWKHNVRKIHEQGQFSVKLNGNKRMTAAKQLNT